MYLEPRVESSLPDILANALEVGEANISKVVSPQWPSYKAYCRVIAPFITIVGAHLIGVSNHIFEEYGETTGLNCMIGPCLSYLTTRLTPSFISHVSSWTFPARLFNWKSTINGRNSTWCESWSPSRRCYPKISFQLIRGQDHPSLIHRSYMAMGQNYITSLEVAKFQDDIYLQAGHNLVNIHHSYLNFPLFWGKPPRTMKFDPPIYIYSQSTWDCGPEIRAFLASQLRIFPSILGDTHPPQFLFQANKKNQRLMSVGCQKTVVKRWVFLGRWSAKKILETVGREATL